MNEEMRLFWPFYIFEFLWGLSALVVPYVIIHFRNIGFSFVQIEIVTVAISLVVLFAEVPTGAVADLIGRKPSVMIGLVLSIISLILVPLFSTLILVVLAWSLMGLGQTFVSGAFEAWVVDKAENKEELVQKYFTRSMLISSIGALVAMLASSVVVALTSIKATFFVTAGGIILATVLLGITGHEHFERQEASIIAALKKFWGHTGSALRYVLKHHELMLVFFGMLFASLMTYGWDGWQPMFTEELLMPEAYMGIVMALFTLPAIILSFFIPKIVKKFKHPKNVIILVLLCEMVFLGGLAFIMPPHYSLAALLGFLASGTRALYYPIANTAIQEHIPSKQRATILSFQSMAIAGCGAIIALGIGWSMDLIGPGMTIALTGLFAIPAVLFFLQLKK